jgi:hypothetical protein
MLQKKTLTPNQKDNHINMWLTPTFHPFNVAWLSCNLFLLLKCVVAYAYVTWPFATRFMTKMCSHIWQRTRMYTHDKKLSIGLG